MDTTDTFMCLGICEQQTQITAGSATPRKCVTHGIQDARQRCIVQCEGIAFIRDRDYLHRPLSNWLWGGNSSWCYTLRWSNWRSSAGRRCL